MSESKTDTRSAGSTPQPTTPVDVQDGELAKKLRYLAGGSLFYDKHGLEITISDRLDHMVPRLVKFIENRDQLHEADKRKAVEEASKYQTKIYKIRTLSNGKEVWGIRIAHDAHQIYGDIANNKEEAEKKLAAELDQLKSLEGKQL